MKKFIVAVVFLSVSVFSCKSVDSSSETSALGTSGSCPVKYINEAVSEITPDERSAVSNLLDTVCRNSNITTRLFSDTYGWEGNASNFHYYLNKYQDETRNATYYTQTGIAMKFPKVTGIEYPELLFKAYTDANWRKQYYVLPSNIRISNVKVLSEFDGESFSLQYTSAITNSVKTVLSAITNTTTYDTTLTFTKISDKLYVFTERSLERERNRAMTRKNISFLIRDYTDQDKIVQLEEREVYFRFGTKNLTDQVQKIMFKLDMTLSTALYNAIRKFQ